MEILTQIILPLSLAFIMFSMGLTLTVEDFTNIKKYPKAFIVGALLQLTSLPIIAYVIASIGIAQNYISPEIAFGLMVIASCPGGVTSNLMVHMSKGNTALSISLTSVMSILSVLTIPLFVNFAYNTFMGAQNTTPLPITKTVIGIFVITLVPVIIGMLIHAKKTEFTKRMEPISSKIATILFVVIILAIVIGKWNLLIENIFTLGPLTLFFNLIVMLVAKLSIKAFGVSVKDQIAIVFECGLQNGTLAVMITLTFLENEMMMLPGGLYSIIMFFTGGAYLLYLRHKNKLVIKA